MTCAASASLAGGGAHPSQPYRRPARFANTAKVTAINRLPASRRMATLVAFALCTEATAHDDALEVPEALLRDLFSNAEKADKKARMRSLKDGSVGRDARRRVQGRAGQLDQR